ncbi:magnesium transporter CorA family protein [Microscilla marina]|uniref:Magnesium and cobalt transport protein, putative n=1 Tax=Microscilla marina ATCC 23134 TaxID=313606 RepID=A1ZMB2_MICM2|nr:CorA family divalent cation transporter [Microscilla marina]EAY28292.1 magnesium and cobalt transport protein, putative [Microscilla marina ATCC 23134]
MIEVFYKDIRAKKVASVDDIEASSAEIFNIRLIDFTQEELQSLAQKYGLHLGVFNKKEDIEISSHYMDLHNQLSITFTVPSYAAESLMEEQNMHIIIKDNIFFTFMSASMEEAINLLTKYRYDFDRLQFNSHEELFVFQVGVITDYFADVVESISDKIKNTFYDTLQPKQFTEQDLDALTKNNFNNFLIREAVSNFQRIILLLRKRFSENDKIVSKLSIEIKDLNVIAEHVANNFERINDLKINVNSKIELEQNNIFKILTIITVCISLPTLIAGIYGMNFTNMPELKVSYGYPLALLGIVLSFVMPLLYFKSKKWF